MTTTAEVVPLNGIQVAPGEPHAGTVELLERLLAEAKRGEIVGMVYGAARPNRHLEYGSVGGPDYWALIAAADLSHRHILDEFRRGNG